MKYTAHTVILVFFCLLVSGLYTHAVVANDPQKAPRFSPRNFPTQNVKSYSYSSNMMARTYDISIGFPSDYENNPNSLYPALIVVDGNRLFSSVHATSTGLAGEIEQPVIISIGTPFEEGLSAYVRRRTYEFSPPGWSMKDAFGQNLTRNCKKYGVKEAKNCVGGAPQFRQEEQYATSHKDLPVSIYMASGTLEMTNPMLEGLAKIVSGQVHFGGVLKSRNYPSLIVHSELHQGLGHNDVVPVTLARGLRLLYAKK